MKATKKGSRQHNNKDFHLYLDIIQAAIWKMDWTESE